jgi:hypothetical protein
MTSVPTPTSSSSGTATPVATATLISQDADFASVNAIGTDGSKLYVAGSSVTTKAARIWSVPTGGGSATPLYDVPWTPTGGCCAESLALIGSDLFWIDPNSGPITDTQILEAASSGKATVTAIYTGSNVGQPIVDGSGLTTDGTLLYAADEVQGTVASLKPDGSNLTIIGQNRYGGFFNTEHPNYIAVAGNTLYIADSGDPVAGTEPGVVTLPTTGGSFSNLFVGAPFVNPSGIAVANNTIYVADQGANTLWQMPIGGGTPTAVVSGAPFVKITAVTLLNGSIYLVDNDTTNGPKVYILSAPPLPAEVGLPEETSGHSNCINEHQGSGLKALLDFFTGNRCNNSYARLAMLRDRSVVSEKLSHGGRH